MTRPAEHPLDRGTVQYRPLDVAGSLPGAAVRLSRPDRVQRLVVAAGQGHRGLHGRVELLLGRLGGWMASRAGVRSGGAGRAQVGGVGRAQVGGVGRAQVREVTNDVVLGVAQARQQDVGLLRRPRRVAGGQHQPAGLRAVPEGPVREDLLDLPGVEPVGHLRRQSLVHPAQELAFRVAERGIPPSPGYVAAARVDVHGGGEPRPQQVPRILMRHGDHMDLVRRDVPRPHVQDGQRVVDPPEPRPAAPVSGPLRGDHRVEPRFPSGGATALDGLLPLGGQEGRDVAHGDHDMHLRAEQ